MYITHKTINCKFFLILNNYIFILAGECPAYMFTGLPAGGGLNLCILHSLGIGVGLNCVFDHRPGRVKKILKRVKKLKTYFFCFKQISKCNTCNSKKNISRNFQKYNFQICSLVTKSYGLFCIFLQTGLSFRHVPTLPYELRNTNFNKKIF